MNKDDYFIHYTWLELLYYSSQGVLKDANTFLTGEFLDDYMKGNISNEQVIEIVESLTPKQQAKLYEQAMNSIDPISPEESLVDLLDIIDPYYSQGGAL